MPRQSDLEQQRLQDAINVLLDWFRAEKMTTMQLCKIRDALRLSYLLGMETEAESHALYTRLMSAEEEGDV